MEIEAKVLLDMAYMDAFLFLTMDRHMHAATAMQLLMHLSRRYPRSRLATYHRPVVPREEPIIV